MQVLTIETTIVVSTSFLSNVLGLPETPAIYRSSGNRSNVVFGRFSLEARTIGAKHAKTVLGPDIVEIELR